MQDSCSCSAISDTIYIMTTDETSARDLYRVRTVFR